jgi:signal peptidase I
MCVRRTTERFLWLLLALLAVHYWILLGFPVPCTVSGSSMAETLLGPHYQLTCEDCGYRFLCDSEGYRDDNRPICPNCGNIMPAGQQRRELSGDRVLIDRTAFVFRDPRRWEVVAFRRPANGGALVVKRVVGLPGERVALRHGDMYVNEQIARKTLDQQRAMRILVHDADFTPRLGNVPPRWQNSTRRDWWERAGKRLVHESSPQRSSIDWLAYRHWRRGARPGKAVAEPVQDLCSYDPERPRREEDVHAVSDLMLSLRVVEMSGKGQLWLGASDGREEFRVALDPGSNRCLVLHNGRQVLSLDGKLPARFDGTSIEVSLFDQQFLLAVAGRTIVARPYERTKAPPPCLEPLAIGAQGLGVTLEALRVYRDVYYTPRQGRKASADLATGVTLAGNEYFVIGDNSLTSDDSRSWAEDRMIARPWLVGRLLMVALPMREATWYGRHFQVPDAGRIRYIR